MDISNLIDDFVRSDEQNRYSNSSTYSREFLLGGRNYSLNAQTSYEDSEYLDDNIRLSVSSYTRDKDSMISVFKKFIEYLSNHGVQASVNFPPIPINSSFERQMFIAKYLQDESHKISDLPQILWTGDRTIREDIRRLSGEDPIQVCGRPFCIPDAVRRNNRVYCESTMHPIFLSENLSQILVLLEGLKAMSKNPLYRNFAIASAADIWEQLSDYAKKRINFVLSEMNQDNQTWFRQLEKESTRGFETERYHANLHNNSANAVLYALKSGSKVFIEYNDAGQSLILNNCRVIPHSFHGDSLKVETNGEIRELLMSQIIRSADSLEALAAN